jgi:hypothetical protein
VDTAVEISPRRNGRRAFLEGLIDYAGLFPPASLGMVEAVAGYRAARSGPRHWMVDRFIVPASRLEELATQLVRVATADEPQWRISVILDGVADRWIEEVATDIDRARSFGTELEPLATLVMAELKIPPRLAGDAVLAAEAGEVARAVARLGPAMPMFEVPTYDDDALAPTLGALADARQERGIVLGAKIRCGGLVAEAFPSPKTVSRFILGCRDLDLPFKATAGLHHPFRHEDPATGFTHHGFINVITAAVLARALGLEADDVTDILNEHDPDAFTVSDTDVRWRSQAATPEQVADARSQFSMGYGSCSFDEPTADLEHLGILT